MNPHHLLAWINTHDCGVTPTAHLVDGGIQIDVLCLHEDGTESVDSTIVNTLQEARDALGY